MFVSNFFILLPIVLLQFFRFFWSSFLENNSLAAETLSVANKVIRIVREASAYAVSQDQ